MAQIVYLYIILIIIFQHFQNTSELGLSSKFILETLQPDSNQLGEKAGSMSHVCSHCSVFLGLHALISLQCVCGVFQTDEHAGCVVLWRRQDSAYMI